MDLKYYKRHYCSDIENVENYEYANKGNTATKDIHWYNNGKINIMTYECQDGFVTGMLKRK